MQCLDVELDPLIKNENYQPIVFCHLFTVADYLTNDKKNEIKNEIFALDNESKKDVHNYKTLICLLIEYFLTKNIFDEQLHY